MQIKTETNHRESSIKAYPQIRKSSSMASLIHGQIPNFDSLESFRKDYATKYHEERQRKSLNKHRYLEQRRNYNIEKQIIKNQHQNDIIRNLKRKQQSSHNLYQEGARTSTYTYSVPANPINGNYEQNSKGQRLMQRDKEKQINRYVRAQNLQTLGNSGYNIINGSSLMKIQQLVPRQSKQQFETKLHSIQSRKKIVIQ